MSLQLASMCALERSQLPAVWSQYGALPSSSQLTFISTSEWGTKPRRLYEDNSQYGYPWTPLQASLHRSRARSHARRHDGCPVPSAVAAARPQKAAPYTVYLSNNYLGNTWRVQMEKSAEAAATLAPLKGKVVLKVENVGQTVPAQITSLDAIIARHPTAILIDASSPTALNPTIATACAQGIVVVNFDQPVTAPCAYRVTSNTNAAAVLDAEWMVGVLHGKGNLYVDSGLPGAPLSNAGVQLDLGVFKKYPGIHVVGYYQSQYAIGPEQQGVASLLSAHPDVDGVMSEAYCTGAIKAFQAAGHALVPMVCAAFNGTMVALATNKGANGITTANPPYLSAEALRIAVNVLGGQKNSCTRFFRSSATTPRARCRSFLRAQSARRSRSA